MTALQRPGIIFPKGPPGAPGEVSKADVNKLQQQIDQLKSQVNSIRAQQGNFATKSDLTRFATKGELAGFAKKGDVLNTSERDFVRTSFGNNAKAGSFIKSIVDKPFLQGKLTGVFADSLSFNDLRSTVGTQGTSITDLTGKFDGLDTKVGTLSSRLDGFQATLAVIKTSVSCVVDALLKAANVVDRLQSQTSFLKTQFGRIGKNERDIQGRWASFRKDFSSTTKGQGALISAKTALTGVRDRVFNKNLPTIEREIGNLASDFGATGENRGVQQGFADMGGNFKDLEAALRSCRRPPA